MNVTAVCAWASDCSEWVRVAVPRIILMPQIHHAWIVDGCDRSYLAAVFAVLMTFAGQPIHHDRPVYGAATPWASKLPLIPNLDSQLNHVRVNMKTKIARQKRTLTSDSMRSSRASIKGSCGMLIQLHP